MSAKLPAVVFIRRRSEFVVGAERAQPTKTARAPAVTFPSAAAMGVRMPTRVKLDVAASSRSGMAFVAGEHIGHWK
ncbi:hypothetical protein CBR_g55281 [Chara braunii]|uniref:Uncharacterized protein n=1 Tax=Chara braunii TaxID=69332 RepID=A0A388MCY9_CHABU|nr:hypothetical protein CBR_g55281 [Chara braunii]|eukprot:GBG92373.1 hypothetical protein CBR_g55281 [Chara braunii]